MINVFLVHSRKDNDEINLFVEYLEGKVDESGKKLEEQGECHCNVLVLQGTQKNWKTEAKQLIRQSQVVIFVQGEDAEEKMDTIGWEIATANKMNKEILLYQLDRELNLPKYLMRLNKFTKREEPMCIPMSKYTIKKRIDDFDKGEYKIFSNEFEKILKSGEKYDTEQIMEQYKMYQKTSEDLVNRRQNVNEFYQTVNGALVALIGIVSGFLEMPSRLWVLLAVACAGIILDFSWLNILETYGILNASKMKVINLIERKLPILLYDAEWQVMSDKLNSKKYVSFTDSEKRIPKIFMGIYTLIIVVILIYFLAALISK